MTAYQSPVNHFNDATTHSSCYSNNGSQNKHRAVWWENKAANTEYLPMLTTLTVNTKRRIPAQACFRGFFFKSPEQSAMLLSGETKSKPQLVFRICSSQLLVVARKNTQRPAIFIHRLPSTAGAVGKSLYYYYRRFAQFTSIILN